jgi:hypothetical protein
MSENTVPASAAPSVIATRHLVKTFVIGDHQVARRFAACRIDGAAR